MWEEMIETTIELRTKTLFTALLILSLFSVGSFALNVGKNATEVQVSYKTFQVGIADISVNVMTIVLPPQEAESIEKQLVEKAVTAEQLSTIYRRIPFSGAKINVTFEETFEKNTRKIVVCEGVTNEQGILECKMNIGAAGGCGLIVARFDGSPSNYEEYGQSEYCLKGTIPSGFILDEQTAVQLLLLFMFFGILAAGLYASGKNPLAAFDITTPKSKGPPAYPGFLYKKVTIPKEIITGFLKKSKGTAEMWKGLGFFPQYLVGRLSSAGISKKRILSLKNEMTNQTQQSQYALAVAASLKNYPGLINRVRLIENRIKTFETKEAKAGLSMSEKKHKQTLVKLKQSKLKAIKTIEALINRNLDYLTSADLINALVSTKNIEIEIFKNMKEAGVNWLSEAQIRIRSEISKSEQIQQTLLVPVMDARLALEHARLAITLEALEEIEYYKKNVAGNVYKKLERELEKYKKTEKEEERIDILLEILRSIGSKVDVALAKINNEINDYSGYFDSFDNQIMTNLKIKEKAKEDLKNKAIQKKEYETVVSSTNNKIRKTLEEGYTKSVVVLGSIEKHHIEKEVPRPEEYFAKLGLTGFENELVNKDIEIGRLGEEIKTLQAEYKKSSEISEKEKKD